MPTLVFDPRAQITRLRAMPRRVEIANTSGRLDDEGRGEEPGTGGFAKFAAPKKPCQTGTAATASDWYGPRLLPTFVAQVLGQVMMDSRDQALTAAPAAYRAAQIGTGALLDRGV